MTKLVCRLLGADDALLGWCAHEAALHGDGYLRAAGPVSIEVDSAGESAVLSIHWADVNVETRVPVPSHRMEPGQSYVVFQRHAPMIQAGQPPPKRLPPVSTKSRVSVSVPVGQLASTGVLV